MKTSVLIPVYKRYNLLSYNLESIFRTKNNIDFEILVLDELDIEDKLVKQIVFKYGNNVKYIHSGSTKEKDSWRVPGFAYNIGSKIANGEIIILCCNDMFHMNNTIDMLSEPFNKDDKIITIPKAENAKDDTGSFLECLESGSNNLEEKFIIQNPLVNYYLPFLMGLNKKQYIDIGGYDEDFVGQDFDDNDIVDRLRIDGCKYIETDSKVIHMYHERLSKNVNSGDERARLYMINKSLYENRKGIIKRNENKNWGFLGEGNV